jgi:hypothetical protein
MRLSSPSSSTWPVGLGFSRHATAGHELHDAKCWQHIPYVTQHHANQLSAHAQFSAAHDQLRVGMRTTAWINQRSIPEEGS